MKNDGHGVRGEEVSRVGIGLGSNLGDRLAHLRAARARLGALAGFVGPLESAPLYETEPLDCTSDSQAFLNTVVEIGYRGHPVTLLDALLAIEVELGRPSKHPRNAPRPLDLDILYFGNLTLRNEEVVIPHPRLHLRRFVLAPLATLRPHLVPPGHGRSVAEQLTQLADPSSVRLVSETW